MTRLERRRFLRGATSAAAVALAGTLVPGPRRTASAAEGREHRLVGEDGFATVVGEVADLERALGIHDLARFTPA